MEAAFLTSLKVAIYKGFYRGMGKILKEGDVKKGLVKYKGGDRSPLSTMSCYSKLVKFCFCSYDNT